MSRSGDICVSQKYVLDGKRFACVWKCFSTISEVNKLSRIAKTKSPSLTDILLGTVTEIQIYFWFVKTTPVMLKDRTACKIRKKFPSTQKSWLSLWEFFVTFNQNLRTFTPFNNSSVRTSWIPHFGLEIDYHLYASKIMLFAFSVDSRLNLSRSGSVRPLYAEATLHVILWV